MRNMPVIASNIINLLVGAALFIVGMSLMSSGLKKVAGKGVRKLFNKLQDEYGYNELDAILVLKDILAHEYLDNKKCQENI